MIDGQRTFEIYGYTSDELRPQSHKPIVVVCEECGRYRDLPKRDYHTLCKSCATTKCWADPEKRKRRSDGIKKHWAHPEARKRRSDAMKKRYEDLTERKKQSDAQKKRYEDPTERTKTSDSNKKRYEDPTERKKQSDIMKKHWADPDARKRQSDAGKKYFEDPKARERHSDACKKRYEDPKVRERRSASLQGIPYDEWVAFAREQKYCPKFNKSMRQYIRDKYNNCDYISGVHKNVCNNYRNLDVHHVDYEKQQGCEDHKWRLIPLSRSNHAKTNFDKPFWNRLFTYALQYDETYYNEELILK